MDNETRFRTVFRHLGGVTAYARRRGSNDPDGLAAEVMTIAWRRLDDVPADDPLPWLYATARNLLLAERRTRGATGDVPETAAVDREPAILEPELEAALLSLSPADREALLLIAWEDLTPAQAAHVLHMNPTAFRVRLLRARRRLRERLAAAERAPLTRLEVEGT